MFTGHHIHYDPKRLGRAQFFEGLINHTFFPMEDLDLDKLFEEELKGFYQPCQPIRWESGIPFYDSEQISQFGLPHHWGVDQYQIIELRETAQPFVTDYDMEMDRRGALRPIHYYNRVERFEMILYQLIGCRGKVPQNVVDTVREEGYNSHPDHVWESVRSILKKHKWSNYYNRIPIILQMLGVQEKIAFGDNNALIREIVNDFRKVSNNYEQIKLLLERSYFPNLRFVAFKLLEKHGAQFQYKIPFVRTPRKEKMLNELWDLIQ